MKIITVDFAFYSKWVHYIHNTNSYPISTGITLLDCITEPDCRGINIVIGARFEILDEKKYTEFVLRCM